jgi:hypothetical protein
MFDVVKQDMIFTRVIRLGELTPIERFTMDSFFENCRSSPNFWDTFFRCERFAHNSFDWAAFWPLFWSP